VTSVHVPLHFGYDILIGSGIINLAGEKSRNLFKSAQTAAIITDNNVGELYLPPVINSLQKAGFNTLTYSITPGENSKNPDEYVKLANWLAKSRLSSSDIIIALGGGVVGDLAGFAAATYLRGLAYVQIPTSLLAMVDSSVGGKTAINLNAGKNLLGAFHQPSLVLSDTDTLNTLPEPVFNDGMAEVIKYAMISDASLLKRLLQTDCKSELLHIITICTGIKRDIVTKDEFDKGERKLLNFGHTLGHAIELLSNYTISHGAAVSVGMTIITKAAVKKALCPQESLYVLEKLLSKYALSCGTKFSAQELFNAALNDKKRQGCHITIVVPTALGRCELMKIPSDSLLDWIETGLGFE